MLRSLRSLLLALALLVPAAALANPPDVIGYHGFLGDEFGDPFEGDVDVEVRLFDAQSGGLELWMADLGTVSVVGGALSLNFGDSALADMLQGAGDFWLEFTLDGETLAPRQQFVSVPFAIQAGDVADQDINPSSVTISGYGEVINNNGEWMGEPIHSPLLLMASP